MNHQLVWPAAQDMDRDGDVGVAEEMDVVVGEVEVEGKDVAVEEVEDLLDLKESQERTSIELSSSKLKDGQRVR